MSSVVLIRGAALASVAAVVAMPAGAGADAPPPSWENERVLDCGGTRVTASFTPGGVLTAFNLDGSTDVLVPKHVEVVLPGTSEPVTTLHVPGFDRNSIRAVVCTYKDPADLAVELWALRGGAVTHVRR
jgi:hypothetical protein